MRPELYQSLYLGSLALVLCTLSGAANANTRRIDAALSSADFDIALAAGGRVAGKFGDMQGEVRTLPDGRLQIHMHFASAATEVPGSVRQTKLLRGEDFFDSERYPQVHFTSEPFEASHLHRGGVLQGELYLRGIRRRETLRLLPAACSEPLVQCPVRAEGRINRQHYGMTSLRLVVGNQVHYRFQLRLERVP